MLKAAFFDKYIFRRYFRTTEIEIEIEQGGFLQQRIFSSVQQKQNTYFISSLLYFSLKNHLKCNSNYYIFRRGRTKRNMFQIISAKKLLKASLGVDWEFQIVEIYLRLKIHNGLI